MPLSIQVAHPPPFSTPPPTHSTVPLMHTAPISGYFTRLLSTPPFSSFPPMSEPSFIIPPRYTPYMQLGEPSNPHPTHFPMPSMQLSEPSMRHSINQYDRRLALWLSEHPGLSGPSSGYPTDPSVGFRTWYDVSGIKKKNGRVYGAGGYAKTIKQRDRSFRMRLADGEGTSTPPILTAEIFETMRNLENTEATHKVTARNAEIEEMKRKQIEMQEEMRRRETELQKEMRRQTLEYQEAMRITNERAQRIDQFFASQNSGGGYGGVSGYEGVVEEEEIEKEEEDV
ncbi:unnamed protein product [Vicia faba]|uniref:Uncharacterized protein n=1 Tax=Vicia faba TaxID=3906 RepID=A0AAV0YNS8_VICFA|nr:unnamed protein product [Vicia faba]